MEKFKIQTRLLSETIFGSGYSIPGYIDSEVVKDDNGFPYMKAKTLKGNLRESMEEVAEILDNGSESIISSLLGDENTGVDNFNNMRISDLRINKNIREKLIGDYKNLNENMEDDILEALTYVRSFTSIDENGSALKGSLRQIRVIRENLIFESEISINRELRMEELVLLVFSLKYMKHFGSMRTRGKGHIENRLFKYIDGSYEDFTEKIILEYESCDYDE